MGCQIIAGIVVGYTMQWAKAIKKIPDPLVYLCAGIVGLAIYWLASPAGIPKGHVRDFIWTGIAFLFTIRGAASISSDTKAAPKTNSL